MGGYGILWPMRFWTKIAFAVVIIWALAGGAIYWARKARPSAESVTAYVQATDIESKNGNERAKSIRHLEDMLNGISYEERQELHRQETTRDFVRKLTPAEQMAFLDATLPAGFKQMMESFNKMEPARRKRILEKALEDMKKQASEAGTTSDAPPVDVRMTQRMVDEGMRAFYNDANAEVKLDVAPLIEQMQRNLQSGR
ncbi:MAG: hypothetical protein JWL59_3485 [Chthoniobacteraceae bacterium]|nr:hypothetical protein [Chthoniobacteraceae bacterium]